MTKYKLLLISLIIAFGMLSSEYIQFEYVCDYPEKGPDFYGFPFVQQTDATWVFSMSGEIYLFGYLGNLMFWTLIFFGITYVLSQILSKLKVVFNVLVIALVCWSVFYTFFYFAAVEWRLEWSHDDFKMNYYQNEIDCERKLKLLNEFIR